MTVIWDYLPGNVGTQPRAQFARLAVASGVTVTKGLAYQIDMTTATAASHGAATEVTDIGALDPLDEWRQYVVALEDLAAGETGFFLLSGWVEVTASATLGIAATGPISPDGDGKFANLAALGVVVRGVAPETAGTDEKVYIWFDGSGFGQINHA